MKVEKEEEGWERRKREEKRKLRLGEEKREGVNRNTEL